MVLWCSQCPLPSELTKSPEGRAKMRSGRADHCFSAHMHVLFEEETRNWTGEDLVRVRLFPGTSWSVARNSVGTEGELGGALSHSLFAQVTGRRPGLSSETGLVVRSHTRNRLSECGRVRGRTRVQAQLRLSRAPCCQTPSSTKKLQAPLPVPVLGITALSAPDGLNA